MRQKTIIAVNGSPRRKGNTAELLNCALEGAASTGAATEMINLYSLNFKGCISCFTCKRKDKPHGSCAMKDDLSPVLEHIKEVDALVLGSPIYFMNLTAGLLGFLERLFFSNYLYSEEIPTVFPKKLPSAFIYTMNMTGAHVAQFGMKERLAFMEGTAGRILGVPSKTLWALDTYQFSDYSKYESSIFSEPAKAAWRKEDWPRMREAAFAMGKALVSGE